MNLTDEDGSQAKRHVMDFYNNYDYSLMTLSMCCEYLIYTCTMDLVNILVDNICYLLLITVNNSVTNITPCMRVG